MLITHGNGCKRVKHPRGSVIQNSLENNIITVVLLDKSTSVRVLYTVTYFLIVFAIKKQNQPLRHHDLNSLFRSVSAVYVHVRFEVCSERVGGSK